MTEQSQTVLAAMLHGNLVFGLRYGLTPETVCRLAKVPLDGLADRESYVPLAWSVAIWRTLVEQLPHVDVGIEMGLFWTLDRVGLPGEVVRHSRTLLEVAEKTVRFSSFIDSSYRDSPLELRIDDQHATLVIPETRGAEIIERSEALAFSMVAQVRMLGAEPVLLREARFSYRRAPPLTTRYEQFFGCPIAFHCADTALVFERATLEQAVQGASPDASAHYEAYLERVLARNLTPELVRAVRNAIAGQLAEGPPTQAGTARALGLSLRSLQRKLDEAGISYRELVEAQRRAIALRLLASPATSINEVAFAAGYRDPGSFVRAFRRWTGRSPSEYRRTS